MKKSLLGLLLVSVMIGGMGAVNAAVDYSDTSCWENGVAPANASGVLYGCDGEEPIITVYGKNLDDSKDVGITIKARNQGATVVTGAVSLDEPYEYGYYYQRGNSYGFSGSAIKDLEREGERLFTGDFKLTGEQILLEGETYSSGVWYTGFVNGNEETNDWATPSHDNLWGGSGDNTDNRGFDTGDFKVKNATAREADVCPGGYHIPSVGEWNAIVYLWDTQHANFTLTNWNLNGLNSQNYGGVSAFLNDMKIPYSTWVKSEDMSCKQGQDKEKWVTLWSSSADSKGKAGLIWFGGSSNQMSTETIRRSAAYVVRCFKNDVITFTVTVSVAGQTEELTGVVQGSQGFVPGSLLTGKKEDDSGFIEYKGQRLFTVDSSYIFSGWTTDCDDGVTSGVVTRNCTFTGEISNVYTITFDANGGNEVESMTGNYNSEIILPGTTRTGYTFSGWTDGTRLYASGGSYTILGDVTLTGEWTPIEYTITFDANGGNEVESMTGNYNLGIILPGTTRTGYTFSGWTDGIILYASGGSYTILGDVTLTGEWTPIEYTITFDTDEGTAIADITGYYNDGIIAPQDPTKTGYTFAGWDRELVKKMPAENTGYKAIWTENKKPSGGSSGGGGRSSKTTDPEDSNPTDKEPSSTDPEDSNPTDNEPSSTDPDDKTPVNPSDDSGNGQQFTEEFQNAYEFAYDNGITTQSPIENADLGEKLTRIQMAKMLSYYAINVLGMTPDETRINKFNDVSEELDAQYDGGVTLAYQLGIMGINMPNNNFRPNDDVPRAEFVTALSRLLYNTSDGEYENTPKYYTYHMEKVVNEGIVTNADSVMKERRGYVMIMLMRSAK